MKKHLEQHPVKGVSPLQKGHQKVDPPKTGGIKLEAEIDVNQPPEVCYRYWRDFKNLPNFLRHIESIAILDDWRSHWTVTAPANTTLEWDAEIIEDHSGERISWRSLENAQVDNAGSVEFLPLAGGRATRIKVAMTYNPPLGKWGVAFSRLFGEDPADQLSDDLNLFKETVERRAAA